MKKIIVTAVSVVLVVVIGLIVAFFISTAPKDKGSFSVGEYTYEISNVNFHTDKTYDKITDYKTAAEERFEDSDSTLLKWMGCEVKHDSDADAWHVRTYIVFPNNMKGGAYDVILRPDGSVIAIWGEK